MYGFNFDNTRVFHSLTLSLMSNRHTTYGLAYAMTHSLSSRQVLIRAHYVHRWFTTMVHDSFRLYSHRLSLSVRAVDRSSYRAHSLEHGENGER